MDTLSYGSQRDTDIRVLKLDTGEVCIIASLASRDDTQVITVDPTEGALGYRAVWGVDVFASVDDARHAIELRRTVKETTYAEAILGYISLGCLGYLLVAKKVKPSIPALPNGAVVQTVVESEWIKVPLRGPHQLCLLPGEEKAAAELGGLEMDGLYYFCETYDITRPFPSACRVDQPEQEFVWNDWLAQPFRAVGLERHCVVLLQGLAECRNFADAEDKPLTVSLMARRSRLHPGTRYNARGLNAASGTGNEVECEQLLWQRKKKEKVVPYSRYLWRRGTVPIWWGAEIKSHLQEAEIKVSDSDPYAGSMRYFENLARKYHGVAAAAGSLEEGSESEEEQGGRGDRKKKMGKKKCKEKKSVPMYCINLLRTGPNKPELGLSDHFERAIKQLKQSGEPFATDLEIISYDWHAQRQALGEEATIEGLWDVLKDPTRRVGFTVGEYIMMPRGASSPLTSGDGSSSSSSSVSRSSSFRPAAAASSSSSWGEGGATSSSGDVPPAPARERQRQRGIIRYNCADSLDRTNAASFFGAVQVLIEQCEHLGCSILRSSFQRAASSESLREQQQWQPQPQPQPQRVRYGPLPEGWEERWDPLNQKVFFIDHNREITTWTHPNILPASPPAPYPEPSSSSAGGNTNNKSCSSWAWFDRSVGDFQTKVLLKPLAALSEMFLSAGDIHADLYTGSKAMHSHVINIFHAKPEEKQSSTATLDNFKITVKRRFVNQFMDATRQRQLEVLLGLHRRMHFPNLADRPLEVFSRPVSSFLLKPVPNLFPSLSSPEALLSLRSRSSSSVWVCPSAAESVDVIILLSEPCCVTQLLLTVTHGANDTTSPRQMDVRMGRQLDSLQLVLEHVSIPRAPAGTLLAYTLPPPLSVEKRASGAAAAGVGVVGEVEPSLLLPLGQSGLGGGPRAQGAGEQRQCLYEFEEAEGTVDFLTRIVAITFHATPGTTMTLGQIEVLGSSVVWNSRRWLRTPQEQAAAAAALSLGLGKKKKKKKKQQQQQRCFNDDPGMAATFPNQAAAVAAAVDVVVPPAPALTTTSLPPMVDLLSINDNDIVSPPYLLAAATATSTTTPMTSTSSWPLSTAAIASSSSNSSNPAAAVVDLFDPRGWNNSQAKGGGGGGAAAVDDDDVAMPTTSGNGMRVSSQHDAIIMAAASSSAPTNNPFADDWDPFGTTSGQPVLAAPAPAPAPPPGSIISNINPFAASSSPPPQQQQLQQPQSRPAVPYHHHHPTMMPPSSSPPAVVVVASPSKPAAVVPVDSSCFGAPHANKKTAAEEEEEEDYDAGTIYGSLVSKVVASRQRQKRSVTTTYVEAMGLEIARLRLGLSAAERDGVLLSLGRDAAAINPNLLVQPVEAANLRKIVSQLSGLMQLIEDEREAAAVGMMSGRPTEAASATCRSSASRAAAADDANNDSSANEEEEILAEWTDHSLLGKCTSERCEVRFTNNEDVAGAMGELEKVIINRGRQEEEEEEVAPVLVCNKCKRRVCSACLAGKGSSLLASGSHEALVGAAAGGGNNIRLRGPPPVDVALCRACCPAILRNAILLDRVRNLARARRLERAHLAARDAMCHLAALGWSSKARGEASRDEVLLTEAPYAALLQAVPTAKGSVPAELLLGDPLLALPEDYDQGQGGERGCNNDTYSCCWRAPTGVREVELAIALSRPAFASRLVLWVNSPCGGGDGGHHHHHHHHGFSSPGAMPMVDIAYGDTMAQRIPLGRWDVGATAAAHTSTQQPSSSSSFSSSSVMGVLPRPQPQQPQAPPNDDGSKSAAAAPCKFSYTFPRSVSCRIIVLRLSLPQAAAGGGGGGYGASSSSSPTPSPFAPLDLLSFEPPPAAAAAAAPSLPSPSAATPPSGLHLCGIQIFGQFLGADNDSDCMLPPLSGQGTELAAHKQLMEQLPVRTRITVAAEERVRLGGRATEHVISNNNSNNVAVVPSSSSSSPSVAGFRLTALKAMWPRPPSSSSSSLRHPPINNNNNNNNIAATSAAATHRSCSCIADDALAVPATLSLRVFVLQEYNRAPVPVEEFQLPLAKPGTSLFFDFASPIVSARALIFVLVGDWMGEKAAMNLLSSVSSAAAEEEGGGELLLLPPQDEALSLAGKIRLHRYGVSEGRWGSRGVGAFTR